MNYFTLFNIPKKFKINQELLSKNFYNLQLKFHPDLFINCSERKKEMALKKCIEINKGYKVLKDSLNRVIYLLFLDGFKVNENTLLLKNKDFLIKYFFLYEELDSLKKNNFNKIKLDIFLDKINKKIQKYEKEIEKELNKKNYDKIIVLIGKLLFFKKIKFNLKKEQRIY